MNENCTCCRWTAPDTSPRNLKEPYQLMAAIHLTVVRINDACRMVMTDRHYLQDSSFHDYKKTINFTTINRLENTVSNLTLTPKTTHLNEHDFLTQILYKNCQVDLSV